VTNDRPHGPRPSAPRGPVLQLKTCSLFCS
jgi:hypothetical protein